MQETLRPGRNVEVSDLKLSTQQTLKLLIEGMRVLLHIRSFRAERRPALRCWSLERDLVMWLACILFGFAIKSQKHQAGSSWCHINRCSLAQLAWSSRGDMVYGFGLKGLGFRSSLNPKHLNP